MSPESYNMSLGSTETSYKSRYGIDKLQDHNYFSWAYACKLLLKERKVWKVVEGTERRPILSRASTTRDPETSQATIVTYTQANVDAWDEKDEEALRIMYFTTSERQQGPIRTAKTAKQAWNELEKIHASRDKQRKFSLMRQLYRIEMSSGSSLSDHERTFDGYVEGLSSMEKDIEEEDLIIIYTTSLPKEYNTWLQGQIAILSNNITLSEFKSRVREEAQRLKNIGVSGTVVDSDDDTAKANVASKKKKKKSGKCWSCGGKGHWERDCWKKSGDEDKRGKTSKKSGKGKKKGKDNENEDENQKSEPAFGSYAHALKASFGNSVYAFKAAADDSIPRNPDVWIMDCGATHYMHPDWSLFLNYKRLRKPIYVKGIKGGLPAVGVEKIVVTDDP